MVNQYGTKSWAKWALNNVEFALLLLKDPDKKWDAETTHLQIVIKSLALLRTELD